MCGAEDVGKPETERRLERTRFAGPFEVDRSGGFFNFRRYMGKQVRSVAIQTIDFIFYLEIRRWKRTMKVQLHIFLKIHRQNHDHKG